MKAVHTLVVIYYDLHNNLVVGLPDCQLRGWEFNPIYIAFVNKSCRTSNFFQPDVCCVFIQKLDGSGPLNSLRGSQMGLGTGFLGEPIMVAATGPRLSTEGPMRNSAENYLRGSTEVWLPKFRPPFHHVMFLNNILEHMRVGVRAFSYNDCNMYFFHTLLYCTNKGINK